MRAPISPRIQDTYGVAYVIPVHVGLLIQKFKFNQSDFSLLLRDPDLFFITQLPNFIIKKGFKGVVAWESKIILFSVDA